jgi:hypothetical protein
MGAVSATSGKVNCFLPKINLGLIFQAYLQKNSFFHQWNVSFDETISTHLKELNIADLHSLICQRTHQPAFSFPFFFSGSGQ